MSWLLDLQGFQSRLYPGFAGQGLTESSIYRLTNGNSKKKSRPGYNFQIMPTLYIVFLSLNLKINFVFTNNADPSEMQHSVIFHVCFHYFPKCHFRGVPRVINLPII